MSEESMDYFSAFTELEELISDMRAVAQIFMELGAINEDRYKIHAYVGVQLYDHSKRAKEAFGALFDEWRRLHPSPGALPDEEPVAARDLEL